MHFGAIANSVVGHGLEFDKNSILAYPDLALLLVIFLISYPACQVTEHHLYSHKKQENNNSSQTRHLYITPVIVYLIPAKHVIPALLLLLSMGVCAYYVINFCI